MRIFAILAMTFLMAMPGSYANETSEKIVCPLLYANGLKQKLPANTTDKFKHCALSCQLALRCDAMDTLSLGILKELWDLISPGNAEWEDLVADMEGTKLATSGEAETDKECNTQCLGIYGDL